MNKDQHYSIGDFAERTGISVRTLHYYDEIGLLKPYKQPGSGHRIYTGRDVLTLQKIVSFKFLGYSLDQIKEMMGEASFDMSLMDTLTLQQQALEQKQEQIRLALQAIKRTITLLEEKGDIDSAVLMTLIHSIQTENEQRKWLERHTSKEIADQLFDRSDEQKLELDKQYLELSEEVKKLFGKPADDPEVQGLVERYMKASLEFVGEEAMNGFGSLESVQLEDLEKMVASPFTQEEEDWLNKAMEHY